jgi:hypothetical protein
MAKNIKFNTNKEAIDLLDNLKGSIENKIRTAYNLGYKDGFKEGASKTAKKMLDRLLEDIEPKDEPQTDGCLRERISYIADGKGKQNEKKK